MGENERLLNPDPPAVPSDMSELKLGVTVIIKKARAASRGDGVQDNIST